ncbi:MAG: penicillin acylase family protein, partial [Candidatus Eremiobacteraeota bacterium]|nr:penicillin acylase family protein [Candidatus Eremiobacteraeota bacterium]
LALPAGESGEYASPYYADETGAWVAGRLRPLPFTDSTVARHTRAVLVLR